MTNKERRLAAIKQTRGEKAKKVQELWALDTPDNDLTEEQKAEVLELTKEIEGLKVDQAEAENDVALEAEVKEASGAIKSPEEPAKTDASVVTEAPPQAKSLGEQYVESKAYQEFFGPGGSVPSGDWTMKGVELNTKATLLSGGTIGGYGQFTQYVPGVVPIADQPLTVADLLPSATADAPLIQYFKERVATNAAAGVAEGAAKPESTFDFTAKSMAVRKIATFLPVSDEMLEDAPAIANYLNSRLTTFIRTEEERQILKGVGAASNEVEGFIDNYALNGVGTAAATGAPGTASFSDIVVIMNQQRGSSMLDPDALIMHPAQFGSILSAYDKNGQYYAGGPVQVGSYGGGQTLNSSRLTAGWSFWDVPIHVTTVVGNGTMLLGNFSQGAQLWRRGGISVSTSNSHSDFFKRNQTAIRAEERLALTIYRPEAFTVINWN